LENYLPKNNWQKFDADIKKNTLVDEEMKNIINGFPRSAHPMGVFLR
jgi:citrate synthase